MANDVGITPQTIFRISAEGATGAVHLSAEAWRVLTQVNGSRSIGEIATNLNADAAQIVRTAVDLFRLGLLAADKQSTVPVRTTVNGVFFENIEKEFVRVIGPIGPILIEEEIANLGEGRENFPRDKVAMLVERVSAQIADEKKRVNFQRIMLEAIRKL